MSKKQLVELIDLVDRVAGQKATVLRADALRTTGYTYATRAGISVVMETYAEHDALFRLHVRDARRHLRLHVSGRRQLLDRFADARWPGLRRTLVGDFGGAHARTPCTFHLARARPIRGGAALGRVAASRSGRPTQLRPSEVADLAALIV